MISYISDGGMTSELHLIDVLHMGSQAYPTGFGDALVAVYTNLHAQLVSKACDLDAAVADTHVDLQSMFAMMANINDTAQSGFVGSGGDIDGMWHDADAHTVLRYLLCG